MCLSPAFLRAKFHLNRLDSISTSEEEEIATSMRTDLFYQTATTRLVDEKIQADGDTLGTTSGYRLVMTAGNRKTSQVNLGVSVGYCNRTKEPYFYINLGYDF